MTHARRRLFIDRPIQGALLLRTFIFWAVSLASQLLIVLFIAIISSSPDDFYAHKPQLWWHLQLSIVASTVVLPILLLDILKLSHRWVGPISRLRYTLHALSRGEVVPPVRFREGDYWQELAGDLNVVAAELNRRRVDVPKDEVTTGRRDPTDTPALMQGTEPPLD
jgi:hypothetical protein